jgi:hypothetical protein
MKIQNNITPTKPITKCIGDVTYGTIFSGTFAGRASVYLVTEPGVFDLGLGNPFKMMFYNFSGSPTTNNFPNIINYVEHPDATLVLK